MLKDEDKRNTSNVLKANGGPARSGRFKAVLNRLRACWAKKRGEKAKGTIFQEGRRRDPAIPRVMTGQTDFCV